MASVDYNLRQQTNFNILSIGSGNGCTDLEILKIINEAFVRLKERHGLDGTVTLFNRAIEPNKNALEVYKNEVSESLPKELENIVFDLDPARAFHEYSVEPKNGVKFDIIHFIHCLYFIDVEQALMHCYNEEMREKGIIILCLDGPNNLTNLLERDDPSVPVNYHLINKTISSVLDKYSWDFKEYFQQHEYDVTDVFDENPVEGNMLLDFLKFKVDFRSNSSREEIEKFLDSIKKYSTFKDGKHIAKEDQRIVVIYK